MEKFIAWLEKNFMPIANKVATQRHLMAIRDTFMTILPPLFFGAIIAVINAGADFGADKTGFLGAWAAFASNNSAILGWLNTVTMSVMSLYVCIGVTYYLCKRYEMDSFLPLIISVAGMLILAVDPISVGYGDVQAQLTYLDGKGILVALFVSIMTVEVYKALTDRHFGEIKMPDSVPPALSASFSALVPSLIVLLIDAAIFTVSYKTTGTCFAANIIKFLSPAQQASDSIWVAMFVGLLLNLGWFFGVHDAVWSGFLDPIEYGTLSLNAAAHAAGQALPHVFTVSFWCYFGIIGGLGNCLAVGILCLLSKRKDINMVGKLGIVPAFFGISEPITFGLPIMLNPLLFIPCVVTSVVNVAISYTLMATNIIGRTYAMLSYSMPSIIGAPLATGDWKTIILIVVLVLIDMAIYYPFFKANEKASEEIADEM